MVNNWKPLTIITKRSTSDVVAVLDPQLNVIDKFDKIKNSKHIGNKRHSTFLKILCQQERNITNVNVTSFLRFNLYHFIFTFDHVQFLKIDIDPSKNRQGNF